MKPPKTKLRPGDYAESSAETSQSPRPKQCGAGCYWYTGGGYFGVRLLRK